MLVHFSTGNLTDEIVEGAAVPGRSKITILNKLGLQRKAHVGGDSATSTRRLAHAAAREERNRAGSRARAGSVRDLVFGVGDGNKARSTSGAGGGEEGSPEEVSKKATVQALLDNASILYNEKSFSPGQYLVALCSRRHI